MDLFFACAPVQPQQCFALRAFKILILFPSLQAQEKLFCFQCSALEQEYEFSVFFLPFISVFGEKPEKKQTVQAIADINQPEKAGQRDDQLYHKAGNQHRHSKLIQAVADRHEPGKTEQQLSEKIHVVASLSSSLFQIIQIIWIYEVFSVRKNGSCCRFSPNSSAYRNLLLWTVRGRNWYTA